MREEKHIKQLFGRLGSTSMIEKIKETPKKYPRKAGTPAKQPLK